jgi:hypothetical protein
MEKFSYIRILMSILLSLSLVQLLKRVAKLIQHPGRDRKFGVHLFWAANNFFQLITFWWWEFSLKDIVTWNFASYFLLIFTFFFFSCGMQPVCSSVLLDSFSKSLHFENGNAKMFTVFVSPFIEFILKL